ncbi:MAG: hypothetical protein AABZ60_23305 [Planctomycetota bacterium]
MIFSELKSLVQEDICVFARPENHPWSYLFDCGQASLLTSGDCQKLRALFVTHTHMDHFMNFMGVFRHLLGTRRTFLVCGPQNIHYNVQGMLRGITWNLISNQDLKVEVREILENTIHCYQLIPPKWDLEILPDRNENSFFEEEGISVRTRILNHRIPSIAYRIEESERINIQKDLPHPSGPWIGHVKTAFLQNKPEQEIVLGTQRFPAKNFFSYITRTPGYSLGYVMDHLASPENHQKMEVLFADLDELYIEGFYRYVDLSYAQKNFHSTARQSGELARRARVKKLRLIHYSRRYAGEIQDLLEEGIAAYEGREPRFQTPPTARFDDPDEHAYA